MWERFKQRQQKRRLNKGWMIGAIATPIFLAMVWWLWLPPDQTLHADSDRQSQNERATLTESQRTLPVSSIETITVVFGVVFLLIHFRMANRSTGTLDFSGADLNGVNFCDANLEKAELSGANLHGANLSGANLNGANLCGANLNGANLNGANLCGANLRYANLNGADLRYANLNDADLRYANLRYADLNCTFLSGANLSDADLRGALLFFINLRDVLNLEPLQLKAKPSPRLCNVALPYYSQPTGLNPNCACNRMPKLLSDRYDISLEEAQEIVYEARQHRWD